MSGHSPGKRVVPAKVKMPAGIAFFALVVVLPEVKGPTIPKRFL